MFKTRLISGIVLMAITIALMVNGGFPLFWVITAISVIGLFELYRAVGMEKTLPAVVGYLSSIVIDILILDNYYEYLLMWLIASLMVLRACYVIYAGHPPFSVLTRSLTGGFKFGNGIPRRQSIPRPFPIWR